MPVDVFTGARAGLLEVGGVLNIVHGLNVINNEVDLSFLVARSGILAVRYEGHTLDGVCAPSLATPRVSLFLRLPRKVS